MPDPSTGPVPISTSLELPQASFPQSNILMHEFGFGFGIAVPVTVVEPDRAPPLMAGAISGVGVEVGVGVAVPVLLGVGVVVRVGVIVGDVVLVGVAVLEGVLVAVPVAVPVGEAVAVGLLVPVAVDVAEGGGVLVIVAVGVLVPVDVDVADGGGELVAVAVGVIVGEFVDVPVWVGVPVAVFVPVAVDVGVVVREGVGVGVDPTTILPLPGVHGTGVATPFGELDSRHSVICSGLLPLAWPWNVTLIMLMGGVGETGLRHANEHFTCPIGGVGAGVLQRIAAQPENGD